MDGERFDDLIKNLEATRITRASALRGLVGGALAAAAVTILGSDSEAAKRAKKTRKRRAGRGQVRTQKADQANAGKITICHRTSSETNPVVVINISANAENPHVDHHDDFVPAAGDNGCCLDSECSDLDDDCNVGRCRLNDDGEGECRQVARDPLPGEGECDDTIACTVRDRCVLVDPDDEDSAAVCQGTPDNSQCDDESLCTTDTCAPDDDDADENGCINELTVICSGDEICDPSTGDCPGGPPCVNPGGLRNGSECTASSQCCSNCCNSSRNDPSDPNVCSNAQQANCL